jgi:hypothetical protein
MRKILYSILVIVLISAVLIPTVALACSPQIKIVKTTLGCDGNYGDGVNVIAGTIVTWRYEVKNIGKDASYLKDIAVTDTVAGVTPVAVRMSPPNNVYSSGDANNDGKLDLTESWTYSANGTAVAGQYNNSGKAKGKWVCQEVTSIDD